MKIAVTGASGHIGYNLVELLRERGHRLRILVHRNDGSFPGDDIERIRSDITCESCLRELVDGSDVVFHLAARISLRDDSNAELTAINVRGTRNIVNACLDAGVSRLVHFSSIHAFCRADGDEMINEMSPAAGGSKASPYDISKAASEAEVREGIRRGLDAVIVNPTAVIGPGDNEPSFLGKVMIMLAEGKLPAVIPGGFDWVDARDVALGALSAAEKAPCGERYLLGGHWASVAELVRLAAACCGRSAPKIVCPYSLAGMAAPLISGWQRRRGAEPFFTRQTLKALEDACPVSHDKAARELDYRPRELAETIRDTVNWFQENGYLKGQTICHE